MTQNPKFSVIIPTYNRANYVAEAVESVFQQTYQGFELIVVNDGSTDDTAEVIRRFGDRICYVEKANGGKASAVNLGLKYVTGDYVWILDDDDIALPNKLELHAAQFAEDPDLKFVYTGYESIEGERSDLPVRSFDARMPPKGDMVMYLFGRFELCSPTVVAHRMCYDRVGCFDERLIRGQDYDMWIRIIRAGFKIGIIVQPTLRCRMHEGDRGSASDRFPASDIAKKNREYLGLIVQKLYWELPLEAFYSRLAQNPDDPILIMKTLLRRLWVMPLPALQDEVLRDLDMLERHVEQHHLSFDEPAHRFLISLKNTTEQTAPRIKKKIEKILNCTHYKV